MHSRQQEIATALNVCAPFTGPESVQAEIDRRVSFIQTCLRESGLKTLVLGISGGVDSTTAGLLAQRAVAGMREAGEGDDYRFIAVRLPYQVQHDEHEAQLAVDAIKPDECHTVNIGTAVLGLAAATQALDPLSPAQRDFVLGNTKARMRMVAQYTIANARQGLVIGTDHAAEAVMGFFTKFGDGACDLTPLAGLGKDQGPEIAAAVWGPDHWALPISWCTRCQPRISKSCPLASPMRPLTVSATATSMIFCRVSRYRTRRPGSSSIPTTRLLTSASCPRSPERSQAFR